MAPPLIPSQLAVYNEDRRPQLYASLIVLLILNNLVVAGRFAANYYDRYRHERFFFHPRHILVEDFLMLLSALFIDVMIANLLASTSYGLGLHSWRINQEDPNYPRNLSNAFKHVWITMVFTAPTFTWIKLTLLCFYRRLFLVSQKWLRIAWWANIVYVALWLVGATGFYLFQCWPVQWYFMRYYSRYQRPSPYHITGQCNATNVTNVSRPLIFGLVSDVAILLLPVFAILRLQMSRSKKIGLCCVFSIGVIACGMDMARIIELSVDTDDVVDPSYGVVIFLILSVSTAVAATICACLPVIFPAIYKAHKRRIEGLNSHHSYPPHSLSEPSANSAPPKGRGFTLLNDDSLFVTTINATDNNKVNGDIELTEVTSSGDRLNGISEGDDRIQQDQGTRIWVERKVDVQFSKDRRNH